MQSVGANNYSPLPSCALKNLRDEFVEAMIR